MPSTPFFSSAIEPASAVTSPSFTTSNGMSFHSRFTSRNKSFTRASKRSAGTPRKREAAFTRLLHVDARRTAADGIHTRQMGRRLLQRIHDAVEVILRVGMKIRIPNRLLAEHDLAINDRRRLAVAAAQIKADAAAVKVAAQRFALRAFRRNVLRVHHFERMIEHLGGDKVRVELAGGLVAIMRGQLRGEWRRAIEINPPAATRPEEELQGAVRGKCSCLRRRAHDPRRSPCGSDGRSRRTVPERG